MPRSEAARPSQNGAKAHSPSRSSGGSTRRSAWAPSSALRFRSRRPPPPTLLLPLLSGAGTDAASFAAAASAAAPPQPALLASRCEGPCDVASALPGVGEDAASNSRCGAGKVASISLQETPSLGAETSGCSGVGSFGVAAGTGFLVKGTDLICIQRAVVQQDVRHRHTAVFTYRVSCAAAEIAVAAAPARSLRCFDAIPTKPPSSSPCFVH
ncbi:uncharacterized protein Tco025E_00002 [Trypanosoma conorhini]|uniref:Uncharacterized protein n=1 Tax=Trypanosoma conorhini TaxID=83891 RepID=A0A422QCC3_9TRYP|nr:uncharacterized protein Tco025E_00002 [Trypanosoma conorhini]RNF27618.1 hypothetical protein Tco025E_00002 [Trypanosoma conorhini]